MIFIFLCYDFHLPPHLHSASYCAWEAIRCVLEDEISIDPQKLKSDSKTYYIEDNQQTFKDRAYTVLRICESYWQDTRHTKHGQSSVHLHETCVQHPQSLDFVQDRDMIEHHEKLVLDTDLEVL